MSINHYTNDEVLRTVYAQDRMVTSDLEMDLAVRLEAATKESTLVCKHLPYESRARLVRASKTPISSGDLLARARAIDEAISRIRYQYPHFFRETS